MASETLVEALEKAGVPEDSRTAIAVNAGILLPILAAHASPEAKRRVLVALLEDEIVDAGIHNETHRSCVLQNAYDLLAPESP